MVLGGSGFIGRHTAAALRARGHTVVIGTRRPRRALAKLPAALRDCELRETHFESLTTRYVWKPLLADIDAVVNTVGILRERGRETYDRVHSMAPTALATACGATIVVDPSNDSPYDALQDRGYVTSIAANAPRCSMMKSTSESPSRQ